MSDGEEEETERICDQCGSPVPKDSPGGMCPKCLVGGVLGGESADDWLNPLPDRTGEKVGDWEILGRLGEGAFGEVFHVAKTEGANDTDGALKILKAGLNSREALARFDAERKALALLNHPNITRIFDSGESKDRQSWFVMEFVDGEPVTDFCRFRDTPIRERLKIFQTICEAVDHAHDKGIVHRDLKPSNVLVSADENGNPTVKLIDFGVAKAVDMPLTQKTLFTHAGVLIGTPEYMSPEQASGKSLDLDARSDVYSLGVLLYELLTGTTPITPARLREAAFDEILRLVREVEASRPSSVGSGNKIATELDWIALKALEKNRERRYADSGELGADVGRYLESKPISARKPGRVYRARKFLARNRKTVIACGLAAALTVLAAIVSSSWSKKKMQQFSPLLTTGDFRPAPFPFKRSTQSDGYLDASKNIADYPATVAGLCRELRDNPEDDHARFRLWAMLALVPYPERIGDPIAAPAGGKITSVVLSAARKLALSSDEDGLFRALSLETGEVVFSEDCGTPIRKLRLSRKGENFAAVAGENGTIFLFDLNELQSHYQFNSQHAGIGALDFGRDSDLLYVGDESGTLTAWPVANGGPPVWTRKLESPARYFASSRRSTGLNHLACGRDDGKIEIFDMFTGNPTGTEMPSYGPLEGIAVFYAGEVVFAATQAGEIVRWDYRIGSELQRTKAAEGELSSFSVNPLASAFVTGSAAPEAVIWAMIEKRSKQIVPTGAPVTAISIDHSGGRRFAVTGTNNGKLRIWDPLRHCYESDVMPAFPGEAMRHASISVNPRRVFAATDFRAQLWSFDYRPVSLQHHKQAGFVHHGTSIPGTELLRFMGEGGAITFDASTRKPLEQTAPIPPGANVTALSRDGLWISAAYGNRVRAWKAPISGVPIPARETVFDGPVSALALSEDGLYAAAATATGAGSVWETASGKVALQFRSEDLNSAATSMSLEHGFAAIGFENGKIRLFDLGTQNEIDTGPAAFPNPVDALGISSKGTVAMGFRNGICRLINPSAGFASGETHIDLPHSAGLADLDFSPDGRWIICGLQEPYSHFWDARDGRYVFRSHRWTGAVNLVAFSHDQRRIIRIGTGTTGGPSTQQMPPVDDPIPDLLLDYAEGYAGFRIGRDGSPQPVSYADFLDARKKITALPEDGSRVRHWIKWVAAGLGDRDSKPDW